MILNIYIYKYIPNKQACGNRQIWNKILQKYQSVFACKKNSEKQPRGQV